MNSVFLQESNRRFAGRPTKTRRCDWCGKRKALASQILHRVKTRAGERWLCEGCRSPRLPMFGVV